MWPKKSKPKASQKNETAQNPSHRDEDEDLTIASDITVRFEDDFAVLEDLSKKEPT